MDVLNASPKVIRSLRTNAQPILMPPEAAPEGTKGLQVDPAERRRRAEAIRADVGFRARVGQALALRFADEEPSPYVEQRIYDGFPEAKDQALMERFHRADWTDRLGLAECIVDPRLNEFAHRLIFLERPDLLPQTKAVQFRSWVAERVLTKEESVPWMTVKKAVRQAQHLIHDANEKDTELLSEVMNFLLQLGDDHR